MIVAVRLYIKILIYAKKREIFVASPETVKMERTNLLSLKCDQLLTT